MSSLFLDVPMTLASVLGIGFNAYILIAILLTKQITTANNLLLLHLGAVNIFLGVLSLVFTIPARFYQTHWLAAGPSCIIHGFLHTLLHSLALWTICGLNCDRYYAIAAPLHYGHIVNARKVLIGLLIGWILGLSFCFPPVFSVAPYVLTPGLEACTPNFAARGALWYSTLYTALTLLLPLTLIVCCNVKVLMIARYHRHRIASAIYQVTLSAQVTITHQRNPFYVPGGWKLRNSIAGYTVLQIVGSLLIMYPPYYTLIMWRAISGHHQARNSSAFTTPYASLYTVATCFLVFSIPVNGFIYGVKDKVIRRALQNYWRKKQTKNEVNHEIQARTPSTCGSRRPSFSVASVQMRRASESLLDPAHILSHPLGNNNYHTSGNRFPYDVDSTNGNRVEKTCCVDNDNMSHKEETPPIPLKSSKRFTEEVTVTLHSPRKCNVRSKSHDADDGSPKDLHNKKWWSMRSFDGDRFRCQRMLELQESYCHCPAKGPRELAQEGETESLLLESRIDDGSLGEEGKQYTMYKPQRNSLKYAYNPTEGRDIIL